LSFAIDSVIAITIGNNFHRKASIKK